MAFEGPARKDLWIEPGTASYFLHPLKAGWIISTRWLIAESTHGARARFNAAHLVALPQELDRAAIRIELKALQFWGDGKEGLRPHMAKAFL